MFSEHLKEGMTKIESTNVDFPENKFPSAGEDTLSMFNLVEVLH